MSTSPPPSTAIVRPPAFRAPRCAPPSMPRARPLITVSPARSKLAATARPGPGRGAWRAVSRRSPRRGHPAATAEPRTKSSQADRGFRGVLGDTQATRAARARCRALANGQFLLNIDFFQGGGDPQAQLSAYAWHLAKLAGRGGEDRLGEPKRASRACRSRGPTPRNEAQARRMDSIAGSVMPGIQIAIRYRSGPGEARSPRRIRLARGSSSGGNLSWLKSRIATAAPELANVPGIPRAAPGLSKSWSKGHCRSAGMPLNY